MAGRDDADRRAGRAEQTQAWKAGFRSQLTKLIGLALWGIAAQMFLGALAGVFAGLLVGRGAFTVLDGIGMFDGLNRLLGEATGWLPTGFMMLGGAALMSCGAGVGIRHALISGNESTARLVINSAIEHAIRAAREDTSARGVGAQLHSITLDELEEPLRERVDILAEHVEGFGIAKFFRRFVSVATLDYVEEVTRQTALKMSGKSDDEPYLTKDIIVKIQENALSVVKKSAARGAMFITVVMIIMPVAALALVFALPAIGSSFIKKL